MCKIIEDLCEEAKAETRVEERNGIALKLLSETGLSVEAIAKATSLSVEEVENLKEKLDTDK